MSLYDAVVWCILSLFSVALFLHSSLAKAISLLDMVKDKLCPAIKPTTMASMFVIQSSKLMDGLCTEDE